MVLYGRLLYAWLPLLAFLLQAFHGGFAHSYCGDNNGGYDPNALCSEDPTTSAIVCTCNAGYTNTGSADNVVCTDSCTIKNGGCGPHAACSHHANTHAVKCTCKPGYTNTGSTVNVVCKDSCTIKNGGCGPHATCSHHANTHAVKCTDKADYTNSGSASEEIRTDTGSASGDIRTGTVSVSKKKKYFAVAFLCCAKCCLVLRSSSVHL
ncbi:unnamed protein product [Rotaria socialis]